MKRLSLALVPMALLALLLAACAGEDTVVERVVTVEVERIVREVVVKEVPVEKIVTVEVVMEKEVIREVPVEKEVVRILEVEKIVEVEKAVVVEKEVEVEKIVTVELVVEKEVEVEVVRIVTVEVEKILIATPTPLPAGEPRFGGTLKIVSQGSIATLDPVFSGFYVASSVASHIFETIFGRDANIQLRPRLAQSWSVSPDELTYTYNLRDGVTLHNGRLLTAEDVVASLKRWQDTGSAAAGMFGRFTDDDSISVVDGDTFQVQLTDRLGVLNDLLGAPFFVGWVMDKDQASTPFSEAAPELIGTGPYRFVKWDVGNQVILERHGGYVPRTEAASGYTGETIAYLDRLIWLEIPDESTKIAGLLTGEWDVVDGAVWDFFRELDDDPDIQVPLSKPGNRSTIYLNALIGPMDLVKARQALRAGIDVEALMFALGPQDLWILCPAVYYCGTELEVNDGEELYNEKDIVRAQQLLADSGYAGETTLILNPTDYGTITPLGLVLKPTMEEIGFVVDMPAYDWATVITQYGNTDQWSVGTSWDAHWINGTPTTDHLISGSVGYILRDEELMSLQLAYVQEADKAKRLDIVRQINRQRLEKVPHIILGQFFPITPATKALKGFEFRSYPFYANTWLER